MAKINIGLHKTRPVYIDLDILLRTRLLVQANSGGGKSWLLRRIAEQAFGKVQIIIIDPEGEFATLREKYGYVLVGKGGETPADPKSAALVATKLLELNASAVCDLYEMQARDRHAFVKLFLESMINAPKNLWHPVLVIVDEAHTFAPEKGAGESEASDAMIGLATRGRKREFCAIFATQRLGKLRKDAAAELTNVMVGQTFIDVDRKRAAEALGIPPTEMRQFNDDLKVVEPGNFWALGRAISKERILMEVGGVDTTHELIGKSKRNLEPPPAPEKIRDLLPSLADIPVEAEKKAKTEQELRMEIAQLKRQLVVRPAPETKEVRVRELFPALKKGQIEKLEKLTTDLKTIIHDFEIEAIDLNLNFNTLKAAKPMVSEEGDFKGVTVIMSPPKQKEYGSYMGVGVDMPPRKTPQLPPRNIVKQPGTEPNTTIISTISNPQQRILDAIAWLESLGAGDPQQVAVAFLAGYTFGGGAFNNPRGALRTMGLVDYVGKSQIRLTNEGRRFAKFPDMALTTEDLQSSVMKILPNPMQKILRVLIENYPMDISKEECAMKAGYALGGAFNNPLGRLRSLGLVDYPTPSRVKAQPVLFLEG
jgi:hypothetical protein